jgi:hypothetical protein
MNKKSQQQIFLVIVGEDNQLFSQLKINTPKMCNGMVEIAKKYSEQYKHQYKVKRVIQSRDGKIKFV